MPNVSSSYKIHTLIHSFIHSVVRLFIDACRAFTNANDTFAAFGDTINCLDWHNQYWWRTYVTITSHQITSHHTHTRTHTDTHSHFHTQTFTFKRCAMLRCFSPFYSINCIWIWFRWIAVWWVWPSASNPINKMQSKWCKSANRKCKY